MARARTVAAAVQFLGAVLVCAAVAVCWIVRGAMPLMGALPGLALAWSLLVWRTRRHADNSMGPWLALLWSIATVWWVTSGEVVLAAVAAVPAAAALFLAVLDARAYLASDKAPRPPADPLRAAQLRRVAIPLWVAALLTLATAAVLAWKELVLAAPGLALAALFGVLAWFQGHGARPRWALGVAGILGCGYAAIGVLAFGGSLRGHGLGIVLGILLAAFLVHLFASLPRMRRPGRQLAAGAVLVAYGGLIVAAVARGVGPVIFLAAVPAFLIIRAIAGPPKPPPVPSPETNR